MLKQGIIPTDNSLLNGLEGINDDNIIEKFAQLLDNPETKKRIVIELGTRILNLFPITHGDEYIVKNGESSFTIIDYIVGNSLGKYIIKDIIHDDGYIFLKSHNVVYGAIESNSISKRMLLDIINVVFFGKKSKITERIKLCKYKKEFLSAIEKIMELGDGKQLKHKKKT